MFWQPLMRFRDPSVPKLDNLRRAAAAGLRVPATWWAPAAALAAGISLPGPPPELGPGPWIVRSGSPTEDTRTTSNAGQLLSLPVRGLAEFSPALRRVVEALPADGRGVRQGAVFVQPLMAAAEAGVAFFDGFYYERAQARGGNEALTSGQARGEVRRGHLARGEPWSDWLTSVYAVFGLRKGGDPRLDLEFARDATGYILLQVRPALFPLARNPTLSLANHKEVLGDLPSPWMVSALVEAGRDLSFPALADPAILDWGEAYAVEAGERAWLNVSFWYRWMDHFGLPRTLVTEGVGGHADGPADGRLLPGRFLAAVPQLLRFQWQCLRALPGLGAALRRLDRTIASAQGLAGLQAATAEGLKLALRGNFAINAALSGMSRVRRLLRLPGAARVVTQDMMEEYGGLTLLPPADRAAALDRWLARYGHRGPLESDLARPRFRELRSVLLQDLLNGTSAAPAAAGRKKGGLLAALLRPFYRIDERREWFRDELMRRWERLRAGVLDEARRLVAAGELDAPEDVFWLRRADLDGAAPLREAAAAGRARVEAVRHVELPQSASLDEIRGLLVQAARARPGETGRRAFPGIALTPAVVEGRAVKADDLVSLLQGAGGELGPEVILVVPTLEPSWAVVFPRVGGVVAELGGELSHASILLREARRPAVVNCAGIFRAVRPGERLRLDGGRGLVELLD
jgi:phosphohistidine swiveling domain-containing protein